MIQMADALAHAHQRGLIHRDVKPKNIILTPQGVAKLTDLGLARATDDKDAAESEAGKAYGTPYYISPEQIRGDVDIDFRADIYSLGATMYHLVTGRPPFDGDTPSAVMHKHLKQPLDPAGSHQHEPVAPASARSSKSRWRRTATSAIARPRTCSKTSRPSRRGEPPPHAHQNVDLDKLGGPGEQGQDGRYRPAAGPAAASCGTTRS